MVTVWNSLLEKAEDARIQFKKWGLVFAQCPYMYVYMYVYVHGGTNDII